MIYRLHPNHSNYKQFLIDADEVESAMGDDCFIYMDSRPTIYLKNWVAVSVIFFEESESLDFPDIICDQLGKLLLSNKAYEALRFLLDSLGEFLPIKSNESASYGYIFNPLKTAEEFNAINKSAVTHTTWGEVENLGFNEEKLSNAALFRTELDNFRGIYCSEVFKQIVEQENLTGLLFTTDLRDKPLD